MSTRSRVLATLCFLPILVLAQDTPTKQSFTIQVSSAQAWTDTGLDLQAGDTVRISAKTDGVPKDGSVPACDPKGIGETTGESLPIPSAPEGALIARLHGQGASPILVGTGTELHIEEVSHLFLGMNLAGTAHCEGSFVVDVQRMSGVNTARDVNSTNSQAANTQSTRGQQLKSQLATAAQVFMSGQFGVGNKSSSAESAALSSSSGSTEVGTAAVPLKISEDPLDRELREQLDSLPRRVNDQFQHLGDMVNFVIIGVQKDVQAALEAASWHVADTNNQRAVLNAVMQTYDSKDYLAMPMSTLYLFGRKQDYGYEMAEPIAMIASRHHFRLWKAPFTWKGREVWVGAGTHDIGFAKDQRNGSVTHKIDPAVDGERDNIGSSLQKANKVTTLSYYLPSDPVQEAKNATGDGYHSDGRLLVMFLQ
jgi:LssY C-terminus